MIYIYMIYKYENIYIYMIYMYIYPKLYTCFPGSSSFILNKVRRFWERHQWKSAFFCERMADSGFSLPAGEIQRPGSIPDGLIDILARDVAAIPAKKNRKVKDKDKDK